MLTTLALLPHDSRVVVKDIVQKLYYIKLMEDLLEEFCLAIKAFLNGDLYKFDAQVGETLCQIRAFKIYILHLSDNFSNKILALYKEFRLTKNKLSDMRTTYQNFLKIHKSNRPDFVKKPLTLEEFFFEMACVNSISEEEYYLFLSHFLCRFNVTDKENIPISINYLSMINALNLSKSYAKKLGHYYQKTLSELSSKFVFSLLSDMPEKSCLKRILPWLNKQADEGRVALPCYPVTEIIIEKMIKMNANLVLLMDVFNKDSQKQIAFCFKGDRALNHFKFHNNSQLNENEPCIVMYGSCWTRKAFCEEFFLSSITKSGGVKNIILANNAAHPQYSGEKLKAFREDPFQALIQEQPNQLPLFERNLARKLSFELTQKKLFADDNGCTINNQGLFFIKHIFCNTISAYTDIIFSRSVNFKVHSKTNHINISPILSPPTANLLDNTM